MAEENSSAMRANLGLGAQSSFSPLGIPTPQVQFPAVRHPGEIAVQATMMAQAGNMQTLQATQVTRPGAMGGAGMGSPLGAFAQQYQMNQSMMSSQQFNPYYAQAMMGIGGYGRGGGFNPGMMPSPTHMTDPSMGIFRPFPQGPSPMVPPVPQLPLVRHPMTPALPSPTFQTPMDYQYNIGRQRGDQFTAAALATPPTIARFGTDIAGGMAGSAVGAALGARFGGPMGARLGAGLGGVAGIALTEMSGLANTAGRMIDNINPVRAMSMRGAQMQSMSQEFVVGGSGLAANGRGLGTRSAMSLGRMIEDVAYDGSFRKETGFSVQDMTRITRMAGEQGVLDMAQSPQQIKGQVTTLAKALKNFMQLVGEPDIGEAIKQVGQMRSMGLGTAEALRSAQNSRMYARMAGTSVGALTETAGLQGAMIFQQSGLSAGLGLQMGQGAMGMARQSVAAGTYNPQQLAMLGGTSGIAQREMQANAAFLKMPMVTAAMASPLSGGGFGLNAKNVEGLVNGKFNINQMASMGADNLMAAVSQHGVGALAMFQMQQNELQDSLGRALGPGQLKQARYHQILNTQKMLGIEGPGGLAMAAKGLGMSDDETRQFMQEASSPEFFSNMRRQADVQIQDVRMQDEELAERTAPGAWTRWGASGSASGFVRGANRFGRDAASGFRNAIEGTANFFGDVTNFSNRSLVRTPAEMLATNPEQARQMAAMSPERRAELRAKYYGGGPGTDEGPLLTVKGIGYGYSGLGGAIRSALGGDAGTLRDVRQAQGGSDIGGFLREGRFTGGGLLERADRLVSGALMGEHSPYEGEEEILRLGKDFKAGSDILFKGITASGSQMDAASNKIAGALGGDRKKAAELESAFASKVIAFAQKRKSDQAWYDTGDLAQINETELKQLMEEAKKEKGINADIDINDLSTAQMQSIISGAGAGTEKVFTPNSMDTLSLGVTTRNVETIKRGRKALSKELFGTGDGFGDTLSGRSGKVMDLMFSGTSETANTLSALYAARQKDPKNKEIEKKIAEIEAEASGADKRMAHAKLKQATEEGVIDEYAHFGDKITGMKGDVLAAVKEAGEAHLAGKEIDGVGEKSVGGVRSKNEVAIQNEKEGWSRLEKELNREFPTAVRTLHQAALALQDVAHSRGTSLGIPRPPGEDGY